MATAITVDAAAPAHARDLVARIAGVIFAPRATYADVAARPHFLGVLTFVLVVSVTGVFLFMSTTVGQEAMLDQQIRQIESFGRTVNDQAYARMEQMAPYARYFAGGGQLVALPLVALIVAGLAFAVFNAALGADATFKQVYAVVAHSGVIIALQQVFVLPLAYARETLAGSTNLAVFLPFLDDNTFVARLLGSIDLFLVWWMVSLAIGLGVLYRKRTGPIAATLLVLYVAIGLTIAAIKTASSGV